MRFFKSSNFCCCALICFMSLPSVQNARAQNQKQEAQQAEIAQQSSGETQTEIKSAVKKLLEITDAQDLADPHLRQSVNYNFETNCLVVQHVFLNDQNKKIATETCTVPVGKLDIDNIRGNNRFLNPHTIGKKRLIKFESINHDTGETETLQFDSFGLVGNKNERESAETAKALVSVIECVQQMNSAKLWKRVNFAEQGFSIILPGEPAHTVKSVQTTDGKMDINLFKFRDDDRSVTYLATASKYPAKTDLSATDAVLGSERDAFIRDSRGKLIKEKKLKLGDYPGRECEIDILDGKVKIMARFYLVKDRLYIVSAVGLPDSISSAETAKFLDSFRSK